MQGDLHHNMILVTAAYTDIPHYGWGRARPFPHPSNLVERMPENEYPESISWVEELTTRVIIEPHDAELICHDENGTTSALPFHSCVVDFHTTALKAKRNFDGTLNDAKSADGKISWDLMCTRDVGVVLMKYLYFGKVGEAITKDNVKSILDVSNMASIEILRNKCFNWTLRNAHVETELALEICNTYDGMSAEIREYITNVKEIWAHWNENP